MLLCRISDSKDTTLFHGNSFTPHIECICRRPETLYWHQRIGRYYFDVCDKTSIDLIGMIFNTATVIIIRWLIGNITSYQTVCFCQATCNIARPFNFVLLLCDHYLKGLSFASDRDWRYWYLNVMWTIIILAILAISVRIFFILYIYKCWKHVPRRILILVLLHGADLLILWC